MGFKQSKEIYDYNYGNIIINNNIAVKQVVAKSFKDKKQKISNFIAQQQIQIIDIQEFDTSLCGNPNLFMINFKYHQTLDDLLQQNRIEELQFKELDITNFLSKVIYNLIPNKIQIHPKEILIPNYTFCDPILFLNKSDILRVKQNLISHQYVAPEVFQDQTYCPISSQIFSVGLICIELMTLQKPEFEKNQENIDKYIQSIHLGWYSQLLKELVSQMVSLLPMNRPNIEEIRQKLDNIKDFSQSRTLKHKTNTTNAGQSFREECYQKENLTPIKEPKLDEHPQGKEHQKIETHKDMKSSQGSYQYTIKKEDHFVSQKKENTYESMQKSNKFKSAHQSPERSIQLSFSVNYKTSRKQSFGYKPKWR
ncbi:hypothetical protein pb186bvf_013729 [Paramecium bursaria]